MAKAVDLESLKIYVNDNIDDFHKNRAAKIADLKPQAILKKNPYLHRALNLTNVNDLVDHLLGSYISSSDEGKFGGFLEGLAIHVCSEIYGGVKSASPGVDLEFSRDGMRYLVGIKSGPAWGNDDQWKKLSDHLDSAIRRVKQADRLAPVEGVCGVCYGRKIHKKDWKHTRLYGQDFWELISGSKTLYKDLIVPIGYRAEEQNEIYNKEKDRAINRFSEFITTHFVVDHALDWGLIVEYVSKTRD